MNHITIEIADDYDASKFDSSINSKKGQNENHPSILVFELEIKLDTKIIYCDLMWNCILIGTTIIYRFIIYRFIINYTY